MECHLARIIGRTNRLSNYGRDPSSLNSLHPVAPAGSATDCTTQQISSISRRNYSLLRRCKKKYKVAWVGGCVLYDAVKLRAAGGFEFWREVPEEHAGEDVLAQLRVMKRYGGCGLIPSGAYHQEVQTTVTNRSFDIPKELAL